MGGVLAENIELPFKTLFVELSVVGGVAVTVVGP